MGTVGSGGYWLEIADEVGTAVLEAVWVGSRDLRPRRRWLVRLGVVAAVATGSWAPPEPDRGGPGDGGAPAPGAAPASGPDVARPPRPDALQVVAAVALIVGRIVARQRLTRHWAERLRRSGHAHPYTTVGVRTALVLLAVRLPARLAAVRHRRRTPSGDRPVGGIS